MMEAHDPTPNRPADALADGDAADTRLVQLLRDAAPTYRVPPPPPLDAMWAHVEAEHFDRPRVLRGAPGWARWARWNGPVAGLAAGLLIGVGVGAALARRAPAPGVAPLPPVVALDAPVLPSPAAPAYRVMTPEYLDETVSLLAALPAQLDGGRPDTRLAAQARDLLSTTRLLLDSPAGHDPEVQSLLDDLELVLAQVVRLPAVQDAEQTELMIEAIEARRVLPRLRTAAAQASAAVVSRSGD